MSYRFGEVFNNKYKYLYYVYPKDGEEEASEYLLMACNADLSLKAVEAAVEAIKTSPSFPKLLAAVKRHIVFLYGKERTDRILRHLFLYESAPWNALTAHAGVWGAKSARAKTLQRLAGDVFAETALPREPPGMFRGEDGLDFDRLNLWHMVWNDGGYNDL